MSPRIPVLALALLLTLPLPALAEESLEERVLRLEEEVRTLREALGARDGTAPDLDAEIDRYLAEQGDLDLGYDDRLRFRDRDGDLDLRIGGRINTDWGFFAAEEDLERAAGEFESGTEFRRARLTVSGTVHGNVELKADYDFGSGAAEFKDVWIGLRGLPLVGRVRVGHQKEPFSLEQMTTGSALTFTERSLADALVPGRNTGVAFLGDWLDGRLAGSAGFFTEAGAQGAGRLTRILAGRVAGVPWRDDGAGDLLLVGASASWRDPRDETRLRSRPENHLAPDVADTGPLDVESADLLGLEAALLLGPFSLQSEYVLWRANAPDLGDPRFRGLYAFASLFLTGERRAFRRDHFDRVSPTADFGEGGPGAVEIAARASFLDLDDARVRGGQVRNLTLGLNWYLNAATRVTLDWIRSRVDDVGDADLLAFRFQLYF